MDIVTSILQIVILLFASWVISRLFIFWMVFSGRNDRVNGKEYTLFCAAMLKYQLYGFAAVTIINGHFGAPFGLIMITGSLIATLVLVGYFSMVVASYPDFVLEGRNYRKYLCISVLLNVFAFVVTIAHSFPLSMLAGLVIATTIIRVAMDVPGDFSKYLKKNKSEEG